MVRWGFTLAVLLSTFSTSTALTATVEQMKPQGIRFTIPDEPGVSLIAIHYSVNSPLHGTAGGQFNYDITHQTNGKWIHENPTVVVNPGDTVNYWVYEIVNGLPRQALDQTWTVALPTTKAPTTTTTTSKPTTAKQTQAPFVASHVPDATTQNANQQASGGFFWNNQPNHQSQTSGSSGSQTMAGSGTCCNCNCTQQAVAPAASSGSASEPVNTQCTSYPCLIFEDDFDTLNLDVWEHEITLAGGGNWEFQYYTNNRTNSYVRDSKLFIKPTLTVDALNEGPDGLMKGALDIWGSQPGDVCTSNMDYGCKRMGNPTNIINPIQSARLRSSRGFSFKYGKVEVEAKMPKGDWIWPAIWLLPLRNAYGKWPASGEIDIVEVRSNEHYQNDKGREVGVSNAGSTLHFGSDFWHNKDPLYLYYLFEATNNIRMTRVVRWGNEHYQDDKGREVGVSNAGSTLHFGSDFWHNKWPKAHGEKLASSGTYADSFHKYELIWDEDHISISIDGTEVLNVTPQQTMWEFGGLDQDGNIDNPWKGASKMAPFDQEFFLILNVAVGGTAFFPDNYHNPRGKPWSDTSDTAPRDFWNAKQSWYPTWHADVNNGEDAAMQIKYIRVYKLKP